MSKTKPARMLIGVAVIAAAAVACRAEAPAANLTPAPATVTVNGVPSGATTAKAQAREDEFRWKERCAIAGERLDKVFAPHNPQGGIDVSISEVFYSPPRNSCVCEVAARKGTLTMLTLYDCLTRETLSTGVVDFSRNMVQTQQADWAREKAQLKAESPPS